MKLVRFPAARVIEINAFILSRGPGKKGPPDKGKLEGALSRIDNAIVYEDLNDLHHWWFVNNSGRSKSPYNHTMDVNLF